MFQTCFQESFNRQQLKLPKAGGKKTSIRKRSYFLLRKDQAGEEFVTQLGMALGGSRNRQARHKFPWRSATKNIGQALDNVIYN